MPDAVYATILDAPFGPLRLESNGRALTALWLPRNGKLSAFKSPLTERDNILKDAVRQLDEYFAGRRRAFDLSLELAGTEFQKRVWRELCKIGFGRTTSYGEIARRIGKPQSCRAVGAANGRNPISIIVPCHRIIGADGTLTGYGGGLETKRWLLELEGVLSPSLLPS